MADQTPVEPTPIPVTTPEVETPAEDVSEPTEEATPTPVGAPNLVDSAALHPDHQAGVVNVNPVEKLEEDVSKQEDEISVEEAEIQKDLTPQEEAAAQVFNKPTDIDGSNIGVTTVDDFNASLPKNEKGQVEIDENGKIVGL